MKKTTKILGILLIAAMLLGALAMTASASQPVQTGPFTVQAVGLQAEDTSTGKIKYLGTEGSSFSKLTYTVVDSQTIRFDYDLWLREADGMGSTNYSDASVILTEYSCEATIIKSFEITYQIGSNSWVYKIEITKSAGHIYDNACDTECNACQATRTVSHDYDQNGECTTAGCGAYQPATDGDGDGYLEIGNVGQLYWFAEQVNSGNREINVELVADITVNSSVLDANGDLNGDPSSFRAWTPIGNSDATAYCGTFQGNGYVISGLYAKNYGVGFFKKIGPYGKVYNLGVLDSYFDNDDGSGGGYASGAIAGSLSGSGIVIENCFSNATIAGNNYLTGGLVGNASIYAGVKNCYYFGKTVGDPFVHSDFIWYDTRSGNNYYVSTVDDGCEFTTAITMEDVTSGKLAYLLGGVFGQNIDNGETVQSYPVISDAKVYSGYTTCDEAQAEPIYTNSNAVSATKPEHSNFVYAVNGNEITKHCGECENLIGKATITAADGKYTGLPVSAVVNATGEYASADLAITYTDAEGNSATTAPTAVGSYTASITVEEKTISTSFTISKGVMSVSVAPTATHEYGDTHLDKAISGKVVIEGNETVEITGTWAWVDGTTTATFTPDAEFVDLFEALEAQNVAITVTPTTPIITITSPSPSIMPGMSIVFDMVVENPHTANPESLPIHYRYVYKIGENGELQTTSWSATKLTIPSDVTVGETIYVYVESYEYEDKYAVGTSNTIALLVGQVDYTQDINDLQAAIDQVAADLATAQQALQAAIDTNADNIADLVANLTAKYNELVALIGQLPEGVESMKEYVDSALAAAQATLQAAIDQVAADLATAQQALQAAIDTNADNIAALVTDLTAKYNELIALIGQLPEGVESMKEYVDSTLAAAQATLQAAIDQVADDLEKAQKELQAAIDTNADNIAALVTDLTAKYNELIALIGQLPDGVESMKEYVDSTLAAAQATLQAAIDQVQANLEKAQEDLQAAIDANETDIEAKVTALSEAIEAAKAAAEAGDAALRSELASAQASLSASISAIAGDLAAAKEELRAAIASGDKALSDKIAALSNALDNVSAAYKAADRSLKSSLTTMIQEADAVLQAAIDQVAADLAAAQQALNEAIASGDKALDDKIAALNTALENAVAASSAADEALSAEMNKAVDALEKAIAQTQKNLDAAKAELAAKDDAMQAELEKLNTFVIVVCVIASTALCGCGVLVYFAFFGKRKLI